MSSKLFQNVSPNQKIFIEVFNLKMLKKSNSLLKFC